MKKKRIGRLFTLRFLFCCLFFCLFCRLNAAQAGIEGDAYRVSYVCNDLRGAKRWQATAEIRHKEGDVYSIVEKMNGRYYGFKGNISWVATTEFERTRDNVKPLNMDQRIFDRSGRLIAVNKQDFDYNKKMVTCVHRDLAGNRTVKKEFGFSGDIINRLLQGLYVQKFLENGEAQRGVQIISPEPAIYNVELKIIDSEELEMNGRSRKAYRLAFDPMLGFFNFAKTFLPKSYVWHSSEPVYELLKYKGLESGVSSPMVEIITRDDNTPKSIPPPGQQ